MTLFKSQGIGISGMASSVPVKRAGREEHLKHFDPAIVGKVTDKTGIKEIRISSEHQTASDLGFSAADHLLDKLSIDRSEIGCLVFVTLSPDYRRPPTSCILQMRLGLSQDCAAIDICHGCAGFIYGQQVLESMMQSSDMKYGLLVLGETVSKVIGRKDHTSMMLGDAGAAVLYERQDDARCTSLLRTEGSRFNRIILPAGGFRDMNPSRESYLCSDGIERSKYDLYMNGMEVTSFFMTAVPDAVKEFLSETGTTIDDYDVIVFHQANYFIIKQLIKRLKIPQEKAAVSLDRYGNTSGVSIPLTICDHFGRLSGSEKVRVLCAGFGVGFAWGVTEAMIVPDKIFPIIESDDCFSEGIIDTAKL